MKPQASPGSNCPQYRKDVSKVCHKCEWYINIKGNHPQSGDQIDQWGCAITFNALIGVGIVQSIENRVGGLQAATESFRNETVKANQLACQVIAATAGQRNGSILLEDQR